MNKPRIYKKYGWWKVEPVIINIGGLPSWDTNSTKASDFVFKLNWPGSGKRGHIIKVPLRRKND